MLKTRLQIVSLQLLQGVLVLNLLVLQTASDIQEPATFSTNTSPASYFRGLRLLPYLLASSPRSSSSQGLSIIPIGYFDPKIYMMHVIEFLKNLTFWEWYILLFW